MNTGAKLRKRMFPAVMLLMVSLFTLNAGAETGDIPPELERWKSWALYGQDEKRCPVRFNDGEVYHCAWPSRLTLTVETTKGEFEQQWRIFAKGWVPLPGSADLWPEQVTLDRETITVVSRNHIPSVWMTPGEHRVTGVFQWKELPEIMRIPPSVGLVSLTMNGKGIDSPVLDKQGQLWLQKRAQASGERDVQEVGIFRLVNDGIPMELVTHLQLRVSGQAREIRLDNVLLEGTIPVRIESPLPVRLGQENELQVQARPGQWTIRIAARFERPVTEIGPVKGMVEREIWSYQSQHHLRMAEIEGVTRIEPNQTDNPTDWKEFPAYIVTPDSTIRFKEIRRGDPDPAPDRLALVRVWWLDFDGKGFTVQDRIQGTMSRQWYLAMNPPGMLGRVSVDGADQLITVYGDDPKAGVELRRGRLDLTADSRYEASTARIPAVGWDHDFQSLSGRLNLPPGWRLLTAQGVDIVPGTWFQRWTLLDFFIMLIIGIGVLKLRSIGWGALALVTMMLIYHEHQAPRYAWLHVLAAMGLLRVLPDGWAKRLIRLWGIGAVVVLLVLSIPFMVQQIRWGVYPQLEYPANSRMEPAMPVMEMENQQLAGSVGGEPEVKQAERMKRDAAKPSLYPSSPSSSYDEAVQQSAPLRKQTIFMQDPNAVIQTGPGLPAWTWRTIDLKWNGPVDKTQELRLWLLSPGINLVLAFIRVILLSLLIYGLLDVRYWRRAYAEKIGAAVATAAILLALVPGICRAQAPGFPPETLIEELRQRLLEKPECLPDCADCSRMELKVDPEHLQILLQIHAEAETAVPLPGSTESWLPENVFVNQIPATGLSKDAEGGLWILAPKGVSMIALTGKTGSGSEMNIPIPLKPHSATVTCEGWDVQGIHPDDDVESSVQLTRLKRRDQDQPEMTGNGLSPFLRVERVLHLGLTWEVSVTVTRLTPPGIPAVISVPLMDGESVITPGIRVDEHQAQVNMDPRATRVQWTSTLKPASELQLRAPEGVPWTETWILDASPIWHCDLSGIPVIHHQDGEGHWRPTWQPWPGEQVEVRISKPSAIPGQQITIDAANLVWTPGNRFNKANLNLQLRSSGGGQHEIVLPEAAELQLVKINDKSQPIRQEGRKVIVPLQPGSRNIELEWHQASESSFLMQSPQVKIGDRAVNAKVTFNMPPRWILWASGPTFGPAVLFWSYLVVVVLAAAGLGRIPLTPLKTYHWILLGLGLTQVSPLVALMIVGWLLALGLRKKTAPPDKWLVFNGTQLGLAGWTLAAMIGFYSAVEKGLLGIPNMQISGNGSSNFQLHWTQDRITELMPQPWVLSLPKLAYHVLMLIWALWLAISLLQWLRWGWTCFSEGKIWMKWVKKAKEEELPPPIPLQ